MDGVIYFELPFDDKKRAKQFYEDTFGWKVNQTEGQGYSMVQTSEDLNPVNPYFGKINGAIANRSEIINQPLIIINVENLDEKLKIVEENGGTILRGKGDVGDAGYAAYIKDTEGNIVGLWQHK